MSIISIDSIISIVLIYNAAKQYLLLQLSTKKGTEMSVPLERLAATYFSTNECSIIGDAGLNFSVRNGKR